MAAVPLEIPPGVVFMGARSATQSNWREAHLIRWDNKTMRPIRGWEEQYNPMFPFASRVRRMHRWSATNGEIWTAYLCEQHIYVETNSNFYNISPTPPIVPPTAAGIRGYGDDKYNLLLYGTPRPAGVSRLRRYTPAYTLDNWGEDLLAMTSPDGRLLKWTPDTTAPIDLMTAVTNAPISNRAFCVTPERHVMLMGMGGAFDTFGWCDQEDITDWAFADITSKAGFYDIQPKSPIIGRRVFFGGVLLFTMVATYIVRFVGLPYVYAYEEIGRPAIPLNAQSIADIPDGVIWPSVNGWWLCNGTSISQIPCDIWDWVVRRWDFQNSLYESNVVHIANKNEVWWFFVDVANPPYPSRCAIYNYRDKIWTMGKVGRTAGISYANDANPIMSDGNKVFRHESGWNYSGTDMPWIETFALNSQQGSEYLTIKNIFPNVSMDASALQFNVSKVNERADMTTEYYSPLRKVRQNGYVDIRETARDMRIRINMVEGKDWGTLGPMIVDMTPRGRKMGTGIG